MALHWLLNLHLTSAFSYFTALQLDVTTGHLIIDSEAGSFFHYIFRSPIKASLGPSVPSFGERESYQCFFVRMEGGEEGHEASWNRICWLGNAPTAGNVFPFHSPLKRRLMESVFVRVQLLSVGFPPHFYLPLSVSDLFILYYAVPEDRRGAVLISLSQLFFSWVGD